jgi:hypothetical protein
MRQEEESKYAEYRRFSVNEGFHDMKRFISIVDLLYRATPIQIEKDAEGYKWQISTQAYNKLAYWMPTNPSIRRRVLVK